ncbi:hypothetical protein Tco_0359379 [Tanacetum coccineum]
MLQQQALDREAKMKEIRNEAMARVQLIDTQIRNEEMKMLATSAERMNSNDAAIIEASTREIPNKYRHNPRRRSDIQEELYEESSDQEEFYDEDSSDLEEYLGMFDETDQEEDLGEYDTDQDDSDDGGTKLHGMKELIHGKRQNQQCEANMDRINLRCSVQLKDMADDNKFNADAFREYTPPPEEGIQRRNSPAADVQSVAINENATRRLPIGNHCIRHLIVSRSLSTTLKRKSPAADVLTVGTSRNVRRRLSIRNHDVVDRTCVPVSRIFQRFKDMPTNNVEPEYRTHTGPKFNSAMLVKERFAENERKELSWGQANYQ